MSDTPMVERETMSGLRERIAREFELFKADVERALIVRHDVPWTEWIQRRADRILSDPELSRALRVMEQEPVAWRVESLYGSFVGYVGKDEAARWAALGHTVTPLVALPTEDPEDG